MHIQQFAHFLNYKPSVIAATALLTSIRVNHAQTYLLDPTTELRKEAKLWYKSSEILCVSKNIIDYE